MPPRPQRPLHHARPVAGDCLSALGHPVLETPALDALAARGVLFANHWANAAPCGPSRACLYTGTYQHHNRSLLNGTPLDARFTNVALIARETGYDPVLFGYTDTSVDPRTVPAGDPRLYSYEGVLPGFRALIEDPWEQGSSGLGALAGRAGFRRPRRTRTTSTSRWRASPAPTTTARPGRRPASRSSSPRRPSSARPWSTGSSSRGRALLRARLVHPAPPAPSQPARATTTSTPPRMSAPSPGAPTPGGGGGLHPFAAVATRHPGVGAPARRGRATAGQGHLLRRTARGRRRAGPALRVPRVVGLAESTLVVLTSDHGEMGGDHWLLEKLGYWDESYHVPLIVVDPRPVGRPDAGTVVDAVTESVDVLPTICDFMGAEVPLQADGWSLAPFLRGEPAARALARHGPLRMGLLGSGQSLRRDRRFGLPMSHCSLAVSRGPRYKYVQFAAARSAAAAALRPGRGSGQRHNSGVGRPCPGGGAAPRPPGQPRRNCCTGTCARPSGRSAAPSSTPSGAWSRPATPGGEPGAVAAPSRAVGRCGRC